MLIEEYRGSVLECTHDGRICVVDGSGQTVLHYGNMDTLTYYRSCAKPFQLLPLINRGLHKKYGLSEDEVVVCAASHHGEPEHIAALTSILRKTGLSEDDMIMLPTLPWNAAARAEAQKNGPRKLYHNCAGKHLALMLLQRELMGSVQGYQNLDSAVQRQVIAAVADVSNCTVSEVTTGIDGCGVPVFAVKMPSIARAFMLLAAPDSKLAPNGLDYIAECIKKYPHMISGNTTLCGRLNGTDNLIAKGGADGVYGFGLMHEGLGVCIKISDGSAGVLPIIIAEVLRQLGYRDDAAFDVLHSLKSTVKQNDNLTEIGNIRPVFCLTR